ncbi:putative carbonic anhydrase-related protein 10 [Penaeus vannamei]|uniref:Putative carbonic anhydrase-related protein 10 n=1 Tax=Penaeus vannamei TaxID=6689 RepID=A0A3R7NA25_PENVA|nr:putative carbonic anhydrase-related protein 10 [Penaeus vannamei]
MSLSRRFQQGERGAIDSVMGRQKRRGSSSSPPGINWSQWWTYDGISGPRFWGVINPAWGMCREGRRQSPINVDPKTLLFDPNLTPFTLDKVTVAGELINTGHSVEWRAARDSVMVNITGGPLSYVYTVTHARLHFGERDQQGSEHLLDNRAFPAELQLYGYNSQLYRNFSQASGQVYGVVGIALLVQLGERMTPEFRVLLEGVDSITYGGSSVAAASLVVSGLLPSTEHYLTYEGSLTEPACHETVTWIIPNKPLYINVAMTGLFSEFQSINELLLFKMGWAFFDEWAEWEMRRVLR